MVGGEVVCKKCGLHMAMPGSEMPTEVSGYFVKRSGLERQIYKFTNLEGVGGGGGIR